MAGIKVPKLICHLENDEQVVLCGSWNNNNNNIRTYIISCTEWPAIKRNDRVQLPYLSEDS